jgi:hypothetical protein
MLLDFVSLQIEFNRKIEQTWVALKPLIESMELDTTATNTPHAADAHSASYSSSGAANLLTDRDLDDDADDVNNNVHSPSSPRSYGRDTIVGV